MSIFILGMHRSGTSAAAGLLASMGAYIAPEALMLPATADNPRGFFERTDVLSINQAIMKSQRCNWYTVAYFDGRQPIAHDIRQRIHTIFDEMDEHAVFAIKDPRLCLTLPYWLAEKEKKPLIILVIRHPASIADSLRIRNGISIDAGLVLWEQYMSQALLHIVGLDVITVSYEALIAQPQQTSNVLHHTLTHHFPTLTPPRPQTIDSMLNHASAHHIILSDKQKALWQRLIALQS